MKILFLTGGTKEPSSRFRAHQFFPHFADNGIECIHRSAYGDRYNDVFNSGLGHLYKLSCRLKRAAYTIGSRHYDVVFLQRTALPYTALPERLAALHNQRLIYDFDDSVFLGPSGLPDRLRQRTFREAVRLSAHVIAGNEYLSECADAPEKTSIIPTVIDTDRYRPGSTSRDPGHVVIGWMGTASNFVYFPEIAPTIYRLLDEYPQLRFRIVSNAVYEPFTGHGRIEQIPWSENDELAQLQAFDVGLMPLVDTAWTRGKCGFKLIQYMSVGCPVVASAVGANVEIVSRSGSGYLVDSEGEWYARLRTLLEDEALRRQMGAAARQHVVQNYSVSSVLPTYLRLFEEVARRR